MSTFLATFLTLLGLFAVVSLAGYALVLLAALLFDAVVGRLALPGPARVTTTRGAQRRPARLRPAQSALWSVRAAPRPF